MLVGGRCDDTPNREALERDRSTMRERRRPLVIVVPMGRYPLPKRRRLLSEGARVPSGTHQWCVLPDSVCASNDHEPTNQTDFIIDNGNVGLHLRSNDVLHKTGSEYRWVDYDTK